MRRVYTACFYSVSGSDKSATNFKMQYFTTNYKNRHHRFIVRFPMGLAFLSITSFFRRGNEEYWSICFLRPDAFPGVDYMRGMQYKIVINITFCSDLN